MSKTWEECAPKSLDDQAEYFCRKFPQVNRLQVVDMRERFRFHCTSKSGTMAQLGMDQAMRLLEEKDEVRTYVQLREMVRAIDFDGDSRLSFLEWACAVFHKSWADVISDNRTEDVDQAEQQELEAKRKIEDALNANAQLTRQLSQDQEERKQREEEEKRAKEERERQAAEDARLQEERAPPIIKKALHFQHAAMQTKDSTQDNAARIKAEAAARREAKARAAEEKHALEEAERKIEEAKLVAEEAERGRLAAEAAAIEAERIRYEQEKQAAEAAEKAMVDKIKAERLAGRHKMASRVVGGVVGGTAA